MAKTNRGKGLRNSENRGRGTCPVCKTTRIKVLYDTEVDGESVKVCKRCRKK